MSSVPFDKLFFSKTRDYLDVYLLKQAGRSRHTWKAYKNTLGQFYDYVTDRNGISPMKFRFSDCSYQFVLGFSQYMQEEMKYQPGTVNQKLAAIKSYLKYAADGDISNVQTYLAVKKVPELTVPKTLRPIMEKDALAVFLDSPSHSRIGNRDRMILILLFDTAVRVSELTAVTLGDILLDVESPVVLIHGKGRKERSLTLSVQAGKHLKAYIHAFHGECPDPARPLFYTVIKGKTASMSERNVERIVKKYGDKIREGRSDIPESTYPHLLRRSRATGLYRDGVPLEVVSTLLGHANTETTRLHYASPSVEQLREAMQKSSIKGNDEEPAWKGRETELKAMFGL